MVRTFFLIVVFVYACSCLFALLPINKDHSNNESSSTVLSDSTIINQNGNVENNAVDNSRINSGIEAKNSEITNKSLMKNSNIHINNLALESSKINSGIKAELVETKNSELNLYPLNLVIFWQDIFNLSLG